MKFLLILVGCISYICNIEKLYMFYLIYVFKKKKITSDWWWNEVCQNIVCQFVEKFLLLVIYVILDIFYIAQSVITVWYLVFSSICTMSISNLVDIYWYFLINSTTILNCKQSFNWKYASAMNHGKGVEAKVDLFTFLC